MVVSAVLVSDGVILVIKLFGIIMWLQEMKCREEGEMGCHHRHVLEKEDVAQIGLLTFLGP